LAHAGKSCGIMIIWLFLTSKAPLYVWIFIDCKVYDGAITSILTSIQESCKTLRFPKLMEIT
jgi:hypothetical protein